MVKRFSFLVALLVASPLSAGVATEKYDWHPAKGVQDIHVEADRVIVSSLEFDMGDRMKPLQASTAKAVARVDNNGFLAYEVGVAIAIFDGDGNIVAAGSGGVKMGSLGKGERDTFTIRFPYVYRNLANAKTFTVTLETRERGSKSKPKPTP
jgi:CubicO group peptidase (beta-lactamase class C family)